MNFLNKLVWVLLFSWNIMLLLASPLSIPVAMAEEEKPAVHKFNELTSEEKSAHFDRINKAIHQKQERFRLFINCKPVEAIAFLSDEAKRIGLNKEAILAMAKLRLEVTQRPINHQKALETIVNNMKIEADESYDPFDVNTLLPLATHFLFIQVNVSGQAFHVEVSLQKDVIDYGESKVNGTVPTWLVDALGTHANDPEYIVSGISQLMDRFIADYLRINETACK